MVVEFKRIVVLAVVAAASATAQTTARSPAAGGCPIGVKHVGTVRVGMTVAQAKQALPGVAIEETADGDGAKLFSVGTPGMEMDLYADDGEAPTERIHIVVIRVFGVRCKTPEGVHVGMTIKDVEKVYGRVLSREVTEIESREYAKFKSQPAWLGIQIDDDNDGAGPKVQSLWVSDAEK